MANRRDWFSHNERLVKFMSDLVVSDVRVNAIALSQIFPATSDAAEVVNKGQEEQGNPTSLPQKNLWLISWTFAVLLVREAERCNVPLPEPGSSLGRWLDEIFVPAYRDAFLRET